MQKEKTTNKARQIIAEELNFPYWEKISIKTVEHFFDRILPIAEKNKTQYWEYKKNFYDLIAQEKILKEADRQLLKSRIKSKAKKYYHKDLDILLPEENRRKLYDFLESKRIKQKAKLPNAMIKHYLDKAVEEYSKSKQKST